MPDRKVVIHHPNSRGYRSVSVNGTLKGRCSRIESAYAVDGKRQTFYLIEILVSCEFKAVKRDALTLQDVREYFGEKTKCAAEK
jgi:hypothetical protein